MKTLKLLTATALVTGFFTFAMPVQAAEETSWFQTMKQSVQAWFNGEQPKSEVETYLDEVTVAVPPMTVEDAARIEPAAGEYQPTLNQALEQDDQSFNSTTLDGNVGSVAAFDDYASPEDLAGIMPTAGGDDAEEITDESVVVVENATDEVIEKAADEVANDVVNEITPSVTTTTDTTTTVAPAADVVTPVVAPVTTPAVAPVAVPVVETPAVEDVIQPEVMTK